jgi:transmembrane sensor
MKKRPLPHMDDEQLIKYLTRELTDADAAAIRRSIEADPAAQQYLEQMEKIWNASGAIKDFQCIDPASDWPALRAKIGFPRIAAKPSALRQARHLTLRFVRVAAAILLVFAAGFMIYYYAGNGALSKMEWTARTAPDHTEAFTLPDGSQVFLNVGSRLVYPTRFKGLKRIVRLDGEAFFEVVPDGDRAFMIHASDLASVEVLGTSFNLRTDTGQRKVMLNVLNGKVAFFPKGKRRQAVEVNKDENAEYHNGTITQDVSLDLNFLSWKTQKLVFENTPLPQVMEQLSRYYHKQFIISDPGVDTLALTGTYQNQALEDVLEEISMVLDIAFTETQGMIRVISLDAESNEK